MTLTEQCRNHALELGFDVCGFTSIDVELRKDYYLQWIAEQKHGEMSWMERNNERRLNPEKIIDGAKTIITLGYNYYQEQPDNRAKIATYSLGKDYHNIIFKKLKKFCSWLREHGGDQKPYVDTGPLLEKALAAETGIGWMGKSTVLISKKFGPWLFLGTIVTTLELEPDEVIADHCGSCTKCIDICPTEAITAPYQLDARKCLAYLSIEHKGPIPLEYRKSMGNRVFGCDDCIDICPWHRWAKETREVKFASRDIPDIRETLSWNDDDFTEHFSGTPVSRLKLNRWKRNACVVLGNIGNKDDLPELEKLLSEEDELITEHAEWAIREIKNRES